MTSDNEPADWQPVSGEVARAAQILRNSGSGVTRAVYLLACMPFDTEALAEWLERHPDDPRAGVAAESITRYQGILLDAYLKAAEAGT